jgi:triphosphoribosyl-dephospho-CoA synthase
MYNIPRHKNMTKPSTVKIAEHISKCLQLAILLEVSAYPKPGNVHRTANSQKTRYEHFIASAVAVAPHFSYIANQGVMVPTRNLDLEKIGVGAVIKGAVQDVSEWQHGGNTLLGSIMLLSPIAAAAGMTLGKGRFSITELRGNLRTVVESTTPMDAVDVYDAISVARPEGLGKVPRLDVTDPSSKKKILENQISLFEVFKIASDYDSIASEWVKNYPITFDLGYPYFMQQLKETKDVNTATVQTFLKILSEVPDTFIARKSGLAKSKRVSAQAKEVLELGGLRSPEGRKKLWKLDENLRNVVPILNPGTTADITDAVLAISVLNGYRP